MGDQLLSDCQHRAQSAKCSRPDMRKLYDVDERRSRYPLSLCNVEDLLFERGLDICHETVRLW